MNLSILGKKRAIRVQELSDEGLDLASGVPIKPDQSHMHGFIREPVLSNVDNFIREIGKKQYELGQIDGNVASCDSHVMTYCGKIDIQQDKEGKDKLPKKAVKCHMVCDPIYRNPIYMMAKYSGLKAVEIGKELMEATVDIIPDKIITFTMDKWFSVGEFLEYIHQRKQKFITLIPRHKNRIEEMEKIPIEQFRRIAEKMRITWIRIQLINYNENVRLVVVEDIQDGQRQLFGFLTNDFDRIEEDIVEDYSGRWGIEFWINEGEFLGLDSFPCAELNAVTMHLAIKILA